MRVTRSLLLIVAVAFAATGCTRVQYVAMPGPAQQGPAPQGIDNVVYGQTAPQAYRPAAAPAPVYAANPAPIYRPAPAPLYAAAPAPAMIRPAPVAMVTQTPMQTSMVATGPAAYSAPFQPGGYTLDSGDRLRVVVFGQDGLTNSYVVDASGHIDMPLIGSVAAGGLTTDQLSARIADQLRQGFIREPHVAVEIEAYRPFFILGEVTQPGQYPYVANMTVETAVAIAGGFGPRGYHKSVMISRNAGGRSYRFEVPITYPLCPGDTVQVEERWF
jgi:protein involved in polysaccharide export with SLBB domain